MPPTEEQITERAYAIVQAASNHAPDADGKRPPTPSWAEALQTARRELSEPAPAAGKGEGRKAKGESAAPASAPRTDSDVPKS